MTRATIGPLGSTVGVRCEGDRAEKASGVAPVLRGVVAAVPGAPSFATRALPNRSR